MSQWLKQPTAVTVKLGPFVDNVDGYTAETGLTITQAEVRLSKNGGDMAQKNEATSLAHDELGYYDCLLNTTIGDDSGRRVTLCGLCVCATLRRQQGKSTARAGNSRFGLQTVMGV